MAPSPNTNRPSARTRLDPHLKAVAGRWEAGCHNIAQLHRELVAAGHTLTYRNVYSQLVRYLPEGRKKAGSSSQLPRSPVLARQAVFLLLRRASKIRGRGPRNAGSASISASMPVDQVYELVQQFTQMLRERLGERLDSWLDQVKQTNIPELQSFTAGIEKDKEAVKAGLTWWINNGMVEGHVTKLKLIKRQGYGQAGFPLLRKRVLHAL